MIILHGGAGRMEEARVVADNLEIPRLNYLLLNAPRENPEGGFDWYDGDFNGALNGNGTGPGGQPACCPREALDKVIFELEEQGFERRHIFWLGFSQGSRVTLEYGIRTIHDYGGFIGISGCCGDVEILTRDMTEQARRSEWFISHGSMDEINPINGVRSGIKSLAGHGLPVMYCEFEKGHDIDYEFEMPMIRQWVLRRL